MIECKEIIKSYGPTQVLKGVTIRVEQGEIVSIVGPSGAGKTTLLQIIGTLTNPDSGQVMIGGKDLSRLSAKELARLRANEIGFVFQFHHLLPEFSALENVMIPGYISGQMNTRQIRERAIELLKTVGLDHRATHKPSELSGGEGQRVAVARALMNNPKIVFADEPSGNLDSDNRRELHDLFFELRKASGQTFVIVTHDTELATMSDRQIAMRDGLIVTP